ncbi:hypothetical protein AALC17_17230 [Oscillospiraceae bacterium 38-13]
MKRGFSGPKVSGHTAFGSMFLAKSSPDILSGLIMTVFLLPSKNCKGGGARVCQTVPRNPDGPHPLPQVFGAL